MTDFAVAISVDDEVGHVQLVTDILRHNWKGSFFVGVCTSSTAHAAELGKCDVDDVVVTEGVRFAADPRDDGQRQFAAALRDVAGMRKACALAAGSGALHTIYLRAGSYALSWDRVLALRKEMKRRGKVFAARGRGFGFYAHDTPVGSFEPSFFVFDNAFARARRLWEFELTDFLPHKVTAPGFLALWALARVGVRRFWRYSGEVESDGPMAFDPLRCFLSMDESRLPRELRARLKASYFIEHGVTHGQAMETFLARWGSGLASVRGELEALSRRRDQSRRPWERARELLRHRLVGGWIYRYRYGDMVWPGRLDDVYRAALQGASVVPAELRRVSFDMQSLT